jgi:hypothetical protein
MATVSDPRFEIKDPRFESESAQAERPPAARSAWWSCFIGCLAVAVVAMLLLAAVGIWMWRNWRDLAATGATEVVSQMIDTTDLPVEERQEMKVELRRLTDALREGRLSIEQLVGIVESVVHSPLLTLFVVSAFEKQYLEASGLSEEEKAEGRRALRRFVRGAVDRKISEDASDAVLSHVAEKQPDGTWQLKQRVSDAELRAALAAAARAAEEAGIPEEPEAVDASAELKRIVDEAMKR